MNKIEQALSNPIPLEEAASFFIKVKTAEWTDPPDMEGELEGPFCCPVEQVIAKLSEIIGNKYRKAMAYHVYAQTFRDHAWRAVKIEFYEHAKDEADGAEYYVKRSTALGGPVHVPDIAPPPASTDPKSILLYMIRAEQEAIAAQRELRAMVGDENPMRAGIEEQMVKDQHHLDELWQMMPPGAASQLMGVSPGEQVTEEAAETSEEVVETPESQAAEETAGQEIPPPPEVEEEAPTEEPAPEEKEASLRMKFAFSKIAKTDEELKETGRQRGVTNLAAEATREKGRRGERAGKVLGMLGGGAGGAALGHKVIGGPAGALGGAALGALAGRTTGSELGTEYDIAKNAMALAFAKVAQNDPAAMAPPQDAGEAPQGIPSQAPMASPGPAAPAPSTAEAPPTMPTNYLQAEMLGQQAQQANEAEFYRGKLQQTEQAVQGMAQQFQQTQQQLAGLQQQAAEAGSQVQQAMDQAVQAQDEATRQAMNAAKMRMGMQQMRAQMLEIASQEPDAVAEQQQREQAMAQAQQLQQGLQPMAGEPGGPAPSAGIEGEPQTPGGPAGQAPTPPGASPAAPGGGVDVGQGVTPEAGTYQQQAATAEPAVAMKTGSAAGAVGKEIAKRAPYAALGGALGAGGAAMAPGVEEAQKGVSEVEGQPKSFGQSLRLARAKAGLAAAEHAEEHPTATKIIGGLTGAGLGAVTGPSAMETIKGRAGSIKDSIKRVAS